MSPWRWHIAEVSSAESFGARTAAESAGAEEEEQDAWVARAETRQPVAVSGNCDVSRVGMTGSTVLYMSQLFKVV